jgi:hypothetical protein
MKVRRKAKRQISALSFFAYRPEGLINGKKTRSYPNGDAADSQSDGSRNTDGANTVEAKGSPKVPARNNAKPS